MTTVTATDPLRDPATPPTRHRLHLTGLRPRRGWELHPGVRSDTQLSAGERTADRVRDALGSWPVLAAAVVLVGIGAAGGHGQREWPATALGLLLGGLALAESSLMLMAARRADRTASEAALHDLDSLRRAASGVHEVRDEVEQLRSELARLNVRLERSARPNRPTAAAHPRAGAGTGGTTEAAT